MARPKRLGNCKVHEEETGEIRPAITIDRELGPVCDECAREGIAWSVGGRPNPMPDTEWSGIENKTGNVLCTMIGDDRLFTFEPNELTPLEEGDYCPGRERRNEMCEICGKPPSNYPNWLLSKGKGYHIGCLASDYHAMRESYKRMYDKCIATGVYGPWHDDWEGTYEAKTWGTLED